MRVRPVGVSMWSEGKVEVSCEPRAEAGTVRPGSVFAGCRTSTILAAGGGKGGRAGVIADELLVDGEFGWKTDRRGGGDRGCVRMAATARGTHVGEGEVLLLGREVETVAEHSAHRRRE